MAGHQVACDSCGRVDDELVEVHRAYLTPESWETPEQLSVLADVERWCFACRTHYPHEVAGPTPG